MRTERLSEPHPTPAAEQPEHPPEFAFSSNAVRLSLWQWAVVGLFGLALALFAPLLWERVEPLELEPDYRLPYELGGDYWLYDRYARLAAERYDTLLIGDSVIWGHHVKRDETLSHYLNELAGRERFANLGLDGTHPAALAGLVEHYAGAVEGKKVVLLCNPLWMSSPRQDLQEDREIAFNHSELVPQFVPRIPSYKADTSKRLGNVIARNVPFSAWTTHLQQAYFDQRSIPAWTLQHPTDNPLGQLRKGLPAADAVLPPEAVNQTSWTGHGYKPENFPWVDLETSIQWHSFQRVLEILEGRGNRVFVLVGPLNEHMMQPPSRRRYQEVKRQIAAWLKEKGVAHDVPATLPSELYGDASHPISAGYARLATELITKKFFK